MTKYKPKVYSSLISYVQPDGGLKPLVIFSGLNLFPIAQQRKALGYI